MYTPERQGTAGTSCHNKLHTIWELWYSVLRTFSLLNSAQLTALGPPSARETRESLKLRNMQASSTRYFAMCQPHGRPEPQASLRFPPPFLTPPPPRHHICICMALLATRTAFLAWRGLFLTSGRSSSACFMQYARLCSSGSGSPKLSSCRSCGLKDKGPVKLLYD